MTASALENDSVSDLVTLDATSQSLSAMLPIQATLGTWTAAGSPTVTISSDNVFDGTAPAITFNSDASSVLEFDRLTSTEFTEILTQLGTALQNVSPVLNIPGTNAELPFLGEQVNQLVSFSQMATDLTNDLSAQEIVGLPFAPENGELSSDATFSIAINGGAPVLVTVPAANTQANQTLEALVANINSALAGAGLSSQIAASASGDEIALVAANPSITQFQIQIANPNDNTADTQLGFAPGQTSQSVFQFSTIQSLANLLTKLTGMSVTPQFDPTTNRLSFALDFTDAGFAQTLPLNFSAGLEPLYFDGATSAAITATAGLKSTFEIDLGGLQAVFTGTGPAPANGKLTADAHFTIALGTQNPVNVTVTAAATQTNSNLAGLLSDLNNALAAAGLGGAVVAGQTGGAITLTEVNGAVMQLSAAASDPATTELMLPSKAVQPDFGSNVYLDSGAQLTVSAAVTANMISGSASVGMLGVTVQNASLSYSSMTGLALSASDALDSFTNPATSVTLATALPVTANLVGQFPVTVMPGPGVTGGSGSLGLSLGTPNDLTTVTVTPSAGFTAALGGFSNLSLDDVQQALQGISGLLSGSALGVFSTPLPLIDKSLNDLLGTSVAFTNAATALGGPAQLSALTSTAQGLYNTLISALDALPADVPKDQLIAITDDLQNAISQSMQTAAGLAGALVATAASLSEEIQTLETSGVDASALTMFSSALTQIQNAVPSLQSLSSTIANALGISAPSTLSLNVVTATSPMGTQDQDLEVMLDLKPTYSNMVNVGNLGLGASLGPLTVSSGGMVNVTIGGNAEIDFGFDITNPGVFLLDTTSFGLTAEVNATNLSLTASIGSVSVSVGPGTVTLMNSAGDGPATVSITTVAPATGNQIPVSALSTSDFQFSGIDGVFNAMLPITVFGTSAGTLSVSLNLQNPGDPSVTLPSGLDGILTGSDFSAEVLAAGIKAFLTALENGLVKSLDALPLISNLNLSAGTSVFTTLNNFVSSLASTDLSSGAADAIKNLIESSMSNLLVPTTTDNPNPDVTLNTAGDEIDAYFELKGTDQFTVPIDTHLGGLGLSFTSTGGVSLSLTYDMRLGFALNKTTGFSFLLNPDSNGNEFNFTAAAGLTPGASLTAQLFFLDITATNYENSADMAPGTGLSAMMGISLPDPNSSTPMKGDELSLAQLGSSLFSGVYMGVAGSSLTANLDLALVADINMDPSLPSFSIDLVINYPILPGSSPGAMSEPSVAFDNITLNFGSLFGQILGPIMQDVNGILGPIGPILNFLNGDVPVVSNLTEALGLGPYKWDQFLELASTLVSGSDFDFSSFNTAIGILSTIESLASEVQSFVGDGTMLDFGNYTFNQSTNLQTMSSSTVSSGIPGMLGTQTNPDGSPVTPDQEQPQVQNAIANDMTGGQMGASGGLLQTLTQNTGLDFPILDNPSLIVSFLLGQTVTLVTWTMPTLSVDVPIAVPLGTIPVGPFDVTVTLNGDVALAFNATVGLDTSGIKKGDLLDGLFFGTTKPLLTVTLDVGGGAEVGVYFVSVGVDLVVGSNLSFGFADLNDDGKVYLQQILSDCAFEESGNVFFQLNFEFTVGISFLSYTIQVPIVPAVTLFSFSNDCATQELAHYSTDTGQDAGIAVGTLILNTGPFSGDRQSGAGGSNDFVTVAPVTGKPGVLQVSGFGTSQDYGPGQTDVNGNPDPSYPITGIYASCPPNQNACCVIWRIDRSNRRLLPAAAMPQRRGANVERVESVVEWSRRAWRTAA